MNREWSLDVLYKGYEDPCFQEDLKKLESYVEELKELAKIIKEMPAEEGIPLLIEKEECFFLVLNKLYFYLLLRQSVDTTNADTMNYIDFVDKKDTEISKEEALFDKYIALFPELDTIIEKNEKLKQYAFFLHKRKKKAAHLLSDDVEEAIAKMNLSGGSAWSSLFSYLTSTVAVDYKEGKTTLSEIRNLAYSSDPEVRKSAYEAELACYQKIEAPIAFALNHIKSQVNTVCEMRGYASPLAMTLEQSQMREETLNVLWEACREYLPKFHEYYKRKAEIMGYENGLPWYEMFALLGENNRTFTPEQARDYLLSHFRRFADDLADMVERAFQEEWIDFYPHPGKVGGAFCCNLPYLKQSRVLTNFDGSLSDVVTLAHELGHAYHGMIIQDHLPLNTEYSKPVAETASTFNENVIMDALIEEASGKEKMVLIESQLQDAAQIICDIYSRFLFEQEVFERRKTSFLFPEELKNIMLKAQKEAYGSGLETSTLHPYMWACKGHYYSESLSYYNFPYAFGGLFAKGLYAQYKKEGKEFLPKYRALLYATTVNTVEDVAKIAGIDLTKKDFWKNSLELVSDSIDEFIRLSKEQ